MSRDPCAPIIRGVYHARRAWHVRHGWIAFAAASTGAVGCGGAAATAVWLNSESAHTVPASPRPADWAAWARLQESNSGIAVPQPGTPGWAAFTATHRDPAPDAAPLVHVPEPASVAVLCGALLLAAVAAWWRR